MDGMIAKELEVFAKVEVDKRFEDLTTLHIGGKIAYVVYPETFMALDGIIRIAEKHELPHS